MHEVETKILNVDEGKIISKLAELGARKVLDTKLSVNWFWPKGSKEGQTGWYLRIRTYSNGESEVTWKGKSEVLGASRKHKEINFLISEPKKLTDLFVELGLEKYAYQEKYRKSWVKEDWRFDFDQYPEMPAYLEIEGRDEEHIQRAIVLLDLQGNKTSAEGERVLIQKEYGLDWYDMRF